MLARLGVDGWLVAEAHICMYIQCTYVYTCIYIYMWYMIIN